MLASIPLTIIPLILFNILALTLGAGVWSGTLIGIPMLSGSPWALTVGDLMVVAGIGVLFFEVMK